MRLFLLLAPAFLEWPLAIARRFAEIEPDSAFGGLVTGHKRIYQTVLRSDVRFSPLDRLDPLERNWLDTPADPQSLRQYEKLFGTGALRRMVIADRQIGSGYVTGGPVAPSTLVRLTRDPEMLQRYVVGVLDHSFGSLEHFKPDAVFCYTVAGAPAYALGLACSALSIPFVQLKHTRVGKRMVMDEAIMELMTPVSRAFEANLRDPNRSTVHRQDATQYLKDFREKAQAPEYLAHHFERMRRRQRARHLLRLALGAARGAIRDRGSERDLRRPSPFVQLKHETTVALRARRSLNSKHFLKPGARPKGPFAFLPLHFDPEASTMVVSPMQTNQMSIIEAVSKSLPLGMTSLVKEHSPMLGLRPRGFYQRLRDLPGVVLASPFDSGALLARDAAVTVAINSTSALEAVFFGKPAVVVGHPYFKMLREGLNHCPDLEVLPEAVERALAEPGVSEDRLVSFVAAVFEHSFECPTDVIWGKVTGKTINDHPQVLASIVQALQALKHGSPAQVA